MLGHQFIRTDCCLAYNATDKGSGRMRLASPVFEQHRISINSILRVMLLPSRQEVLCTAWPDSHQVLSGCENGNSSWDACIDISVSRGQGAIGDKYFEVIEVIYPRAASSFFMSATPSPDTAGSEGGWNHISVAPRFYGLPIAKGFSLSNIDGWDVECLYVSPNGPCVVKPTSVMLRTPPDRVVQEMPVRHASKQERSITKESIPAVTSALHAIIESIVWPVCCLHKELPADLSTLATTLMSPDKRTPKAPTASFNISSTSQSITPAFVAGSAGVIGGILLSGPPGVGKTYSLRALQQIQFERCRVNVKEIKLRDILTADNAVAELILSFSNATTSLSETSSCAQLVLILLDEIDSLGSGEADTESQHLVKHYLCKWMDKPPVVITGTYFVFVATTNRPGDVDPQLRTGSRLAKEINFLTSSIADKELLLLSMLTGVVLGIHKDDKAGLAAQLGPRLGGYAAADIALLVGDALRLQERSQKSLQQCLEIVHATITPSCLRSNVITVPPIKYSDIIGHEEAKKCFRRALSYYEKSGGELYHRFGLAAPDGILLYGPPGNSKTRLVMAAAHENGLPVISLSGADVYSAFVGGAEAEIRRAFSIARQSQPCMLFMDELDTLVANRDASGNGDISVESRVLATLLNEMDGIDGPDNGIVVVGTSNRLESIDAALLRKGRLGMSVEMRNPDLEDACALLRYFAGKYSLSDSVLIALLDDVTRYLTPSPFFVPKQISGAEIRRRCQEAAMDCLRDTILGGGGR